MISNALLAVANPVEASSRRGFGFPISESLSAISATIALPSVSSIIARIMAISVSIAPLVTCRGRQKYGREGRPNRAYTQRHVAPKVSHLF